jgi:sulfonate transport system substrate-binding protein
MFAVSSYNKERPDRHEIIVEAIVIRKSRPTFRLWRAACCSALLAAASITCHPASAQDGKLPREAKIKALTVPYFALEFIAQDQGFFKKYNLDVEFVTQVAQGAAGIPAIVADQVQTGQGFGAGPILQARAGGAAVTAVYSGITSTYGDFRFYVKTDSGINSAQDLKGKTVGINNVGSYADIAVQSYMGNAGLSPQDVRRLPVPLPSMCQALMAGQVDAVAMYSLFYVPCEKQNGDKIKVLAKDSDAIPAAAKLYSAYVFADDYIKQNPQIVRAYVAAMRDATEFVAANPDKAKEIVAKRTGFSVDNLLVPSFSAKGCIDKAAAAEWVQVMEKYKAVQPGSVKGAEWVTNEFNPGCP